MELNVEKVGTTLAKVSLKVKADEFQEEIRRGLQQARGRVRMKGFRPGKAPMQVVEREFGARVRGEVRERFVRKAYQDAVDRESLRPLTHPRLAEDDVRQDEESGDLSVDFEITLRPEVELPDYRGLTVESELEEVTEEEIDGALEEVRRQQSRPEPAGEEGVDEQGMVVADLVFEHDGGAVFEREGLRLSPTTPPPGVEPEAFRDGLIGAREGQELEIEMTIPPVVENEEVHGKEGVCKLHVKEAYKMVPPTDEELRKLFEVERDEELRGRVRERLAEAKEAREKARIETALIDRLIEETDFEVPDRLVDEQTEGRLRSAHEELEGQGMSHEDAEAEVEGQRASARAEAERSLRALLIVETIGEKEDLLVKKEDIEAELERIAERNRATVDEVHQYYAENNLQQQMAVEILERKVRTFLRENAEVQQKA